MGRRWTETAALLAGAGIGAAGTAIYLRGSYPVNEVVALAVLLVPVVPPWPVGRRRVRAAILLWLLAGAIGGYFFGIFVLVAGAVAVMCRLLFPPLLGGR